MIDIKPNPTPRELRIFAALQLVFFGIIAWLLWRGAGGLTWPVVIVAVSLVLAVAGLARPASIRLIHRGWMLAVFPIGWTISHLVLALVFYLVFTPVGLIMRMWGYDPLGRSFDREAATYWHERNPDVPTERYFRQF